MLTRVVFLPWICTLASEKKNPIKSIFVTLLYDFALKHFTGNEFKRSIEVRNYVTPQSLTSRAGFERQKKIQQFGPKIRFLRRHF